MKKLKSILLSMIFAASTFSANGFAMKNDKSARNIKYFPDISNLNFIIENLSKDDIKAIKEKLKKEKINEKKPKKEKTNAKKVYKLKKRTLSMKGMFLISKDDKMKRIEEWLATFISDNQK